MVGGSVRGKVRKGGEISVDVVHVLPGCTESLCAGDVCVQTAFCSPHGPPRNDCIQPPDWQEWQPDLLVHDVPLLRICTQRPINGLALKHKLGMRCKRQTLFQNARLMPSGRRQHASYTLLVLLVLTLCFLFPVYSLTPVSVSETTEFC